MQAPRYVETNPAILRLREKSLSNHYDKLTQIKARGSRSIDNTAPFRLNSNNTKVKAESMKNGKTYTDEQLWVDRANRLLEGRIKAIADRKNKWLQAAKTYTPKSNMEPIWRRENKRIQIENEYLAKKLVNPNSDFTVQKFKDDYRQMESYKKNLSKDLYLKYKSMKNLIPLKTSSTHSLLDIPASDQNSPKAHERKQKLSEITESLTRDHLNKVKGKEDNMTERKSLAIPISKLGSEDEVKKKKKHKRQHKLRKSSLDPIITDRSHKQDSEKPTKRHKKHHKSKRHHGIMDIATVPSQSFDHKDTETFESATSKAETLSPAPAKSPSSSVDN